MDNAKIQLLVILKCMSEFTPVFHVKNLVNKTTNFKNRGNPTIDLILTSRPRNFKMVKFLKLDSVISVNKQSQFWSNNSRKKDPKWSIVKYTKYIIIFIFALINFSLNFILAFAKYSNAFHCCLATIIER